MNRLRNRGSRGLQDPRTRGTWARQLGTCYALATLAVLTGCAAGGSPFDDEEGDPVVGAEFELDSSSGCFTSAPHRVLTGGGQFTTGTDFPNSDYTRPNCFNGYLLDLNAYDANYNLGATLAYADAEPTTPTVCRRTQTEAYVWERLASGGRSYLGSAKVSGEWLIGPNGQGFCRTPVVDLERTIPNFVANNTKSYRIALRTRVNDGAGGYTRKRASFATVSGIEHTPRGYMQALTRWVALPRASRSVSSAWQQKGTTVGAQICRHNQLLMSLIEFSRGSFVRAGASAASVDDRLAKLRSAHQIYCGTAGTEAQFVDAISAAVSATLLVRQQLGAQAPTTGTVTLEVFGAEMMQKILELELGRLGTNCGLDPDTIKAFELTGTLPAGTAAEKLLLGTCGGSNSIAQAASNLGVGGDVAGLRPAAAQSELRTCYDALSAAANAAQCNDPRAVNPLSDPPANPLQDQMSPEQACRERTGGYCTAAEVNEVRRAMEERNRERAEIARETKVIQTPSPSAEEQRAAAEARAIEEMRQEGFRDLTQIAIDEAAGKVKLAFELYQALAKIFLGEDPGNPLKLPENKKYCTPDFAPGGWYGIPDTIGNLRIERNPRQMTQGDRLDHCLCMVMDRNYEDPLGATGISSAMCPSEEERVMQECLTAPLGPDDGRKPHCFKDLMPADVLQDTWDARICAQKRCVENQMPATQPDGSCECERRDNALGSSPQLPCRANEVARCTDDTTCNLCTRLDNGTIPWVEPGCLNDPASFPGPLSHWILSNPDLVQIHTVNNQQLMMLGAAPDGTNSVITPLQRKAGYTATGTQLVFDTMISRAPSVGQNLDIQLFCDNASRNLHRSPQITPSGSPCRMNSLAPGSAGTCTFNLNTDCRGDGNVWEIVVQAPSSYRGVVGFGAPRMAGTLTTVPTDIVNPTCPRPAPNTLVPVVNPLYDYVGGGLVRTLPAFGGTFEIPPSTWLPLR